MSWKSRGGEKIVPRRCVLFLCLGSFFTGLLFTNRMWRVPDAKDLMRAYQSEEQRNEFVEEGYNPKKMDQKEETGTILGETSTPDDDIHKFEMKRKGKRKRYTRRVLNKTISHLEIELAAAKMAQESLHKGFPKPNGQKITKTSRRHRYFMVIGIVTAFDSHKQRDSIRDTWMPQGEKRRKLEEEKGIVIRFVINNHATSGRTLDNKAIEAEDKKHGDILMLDHVEGYTESSSKTRLYFATAVSLWDADFYLKVDDDVHVNIATLGTTLARHRSKPRVYVGCMKRGPVLARKDVKYHEPEHWKFGGEGNKYFRHAAGQLYAISNELAKYISIHQHILHTFANEDVSVGSWFIGLDVEYIDDRKLCCGTPPDCEYKTQAGSTCAASFDWSCSGICDSVDRIKEVHGRCGEDKTAVWNTKF